MNPLRDSWLTSRWAFLAPLLVLFAALSVQYSLKVMKPSRDNTLTRGAINRWVMQIQQGVEDGVDISKAYNYPNPPIMAVILWPIAELANIHPLAGALTWYYLKVAMAVWCLLAVFKQVSAMGVPFPPWACGLATLISIRPLMGDLSHGNVNIFILFLVVAGLVAFSRGYDIFAGLLIALAVACKVTPALFLVYFAYKGAWRTLLGSIAGLGIFFVVVPGLVLGWDTNLRDLASWYDVMVKPFITGAFVTSELSNQSLPGVVYRLATHSPSSIEFVENIATPKEYHNLLNLDTASAKWLIKGAMGLFAILGIWLCRASIRPAVAVNRAKLWPEFALVAIGMLVFSERTWKHHCVTLLIPNAVLCYALVYPPAAAWKKQLLIGLMAMSQLLILSTATGLLPDSFAKNAQIYGAYLGAFACLVAGLAVVRISPANAGAVPESPVLLRAA